jgi:hypothetical protein
MKCLFIHHHTPEEPTMPKILHSNHNGNPFSMVAAHIIGIAKKNSGETYIYATDCESYTVTEPYETVKAKLDQCLNSPEVAGLLECIEHRNRTDGDYPALVEHIEKVLRGMK